MPSINYIIATTPTASVSRKRDPYANFALRYHLNILSKILDNSSHIKQVTIVKQESCVDEAIKNEYYDIENFVKEIRSKDIKVEFLDVPKVGISYTQYVLAYNSFPDYDYYIVMEDDWTINLEYKNFDKILLELYKKAFFEKTGFLDCWSPRTGIYVGPNGGFAHHLHHSAISVGMLSNETIKNLIVHIDKKELDLRQITQLEFSNLLVESKAKIIDLPTVGLPTKILFWETTADAIKDFTENKEAIAPLFVPVQFYYRIAQYVGYKKVNQENLFAQ